MLIRPSTSSRTLPSLIYSIGEYDKDRIDFGDGKAWEGRARGKTGWRDQARARGGEHRRGPLLRGPASERLHGVAQIPPQVHALSVTCSSEHFGKFAGLFGTGVTFEHSIQFNIFLQHHNLEIISVLLSDRFSNNHFAAQPRSFFLVDL